MALKMSSALTLLTALTAPAMMLASKQRQHEAATSNPIRKVVTMLQSMQAKVTEEGEKELALYDRFMCYCKTSGGTLQQEIDEAKSKIESLDAAFKAAQEKKAQTEAALQEHLASRSDAKEAMAAATALREKEAAAFANEKEDSETNLAALAKAIPAIEHGMAGAFLQTSAALTVRTFAMEKAELPDETRQELLAFLSGTHSQGYAPQSGEIVGILKQMEDEMTKGLEEATATERAAIESYEALIAAKKREEDALTAQIEEEQTRLGELGAELVTMSNDVEDTKESLAEDSKFLAELQEGCATKTKEWEEITRTRNDELVALSETIKVINDDAALDVFKKTLPSASASFLEIKVNSGALRARALVAVRAAASYNGHLPHRTDLDFIALALSGKKIGFEKVISMIDEMVANLKKEQGDDDSKKEFCEKEFDASEDKKKALDQSIADSETAIAEMEGALATLAEEIAALEAGIKALDKSVAEATEQRKAENSDYKELMTNDAIAKDVLLWAKNRLNQFYNPKLYKPPAKRELTEAEDITVSFGGTLAPTPAPGGIADTGIGAVFAQVSAHTQKKDAPPPPPETFGPYTKKTQESSGVIAMIDLLVHDLDTEMTESDVAEKNAQEQYEATMQEAGKKRAGDAKSISDKIAAKAEQEVALEAETDNKLGTTKELMAELEYIKSLHADCDWLVKYYEARKEARNGEIDALAKAKAVLSGADYSLLQMGNSAKARTFLASRG